jgi:hypothetical protein
MKSQQVLSEYLGDLAGTEVGQMLNRLTNTNPHVNSLGAVPEVKYTVTFLKPANGGFVGLRNTN